MKIDKPENSNYAATVVSLKNIVPLDGCDNVVGTTIFGFQAIIGKNHAIGDFGIVFPAETQLSDEHCHYNNLYRHGDKNMDQGQKGYIEDNRRIRAQKFRGHTSNALFMSLESLGWTGANINDLQEGDEFDHLNGKEICRKYMPKRNAMRNQAPQVKRFSRVDSKHMPEHYDTENFWKNRDKINPEKEVIVTQKIHGTSIRIANTIVKRKINVIERALSFLGVAIQPTEYDYVFGSRKVIKDVNNPNQIHFYETDIWSQEGKKLEGLLPQNYVVYAELIGYTPDGAEIQKNYSYALAKGTTELYIYRIAIINEQGAITDLSWDQVVEFCAQAGIKSVPEMWRGKLKDLVIEDFIDKRFFEGGYRHCLSLGENKEIVDEGVCVRADGLRPYILKAKSPKFLEHETSILDSGVEDLESSQASADIVANITA